MTKDTFKKATKGIKDPQTIIDILVWAAYFAGKFDADLPIDIGRDALEKIEKLLK